MYLPWQPWAIQHKQGDQKIGKKFTQFFQKVAKTATMPKRSGKVNE
jgi:hypothetical protein